MNDLERSEAAARHRYLNDLVEGHAWVYVVGLINERVADLTSTCINPLTPPDAWDQARGGIDALRRVADAPFMEMQDLQSRLEEES